jgi:putative tricarboxylic transport membrane protein
MTKRHGELLISILIFAASLVMYQQAGKIDVGASMAKGGDFMPKVCATLMLIVGGIFLVANAVALSRTKADSSVEPEGGHLDYKKMFFNLLLLIVYAALLPPIGFLITTAAYIAVQMWLFSPKKKRQLVTSPIVGIISSVVIYYTFVSGFKLILPIGILG